MPHCPRHRNPRRAFTLVESLIAMGIVSLGVLGTLALITWALQHNADEQERARAHQMVSEEMETVRLQLFTRQTAGQSRTIWDNGTPDDETDDTEGIIKVLMFDPETGASLTEAPTPAKRIGVEVTLTWHPRGRLSGKTYNETVMSYLVP